MCSSDLDENNIRLSIEDNGPGIPEEIMPQIFDPFFTTKAVGKGTGLGLSIVYGFVNDLGGRIEVDNTPLTRFNIFFPITRPAQQLKTDATRNKE